MAWTAWGIGHHLNAEIEPLDDVLLITGLWSGAIKRDALTVARFAAPLLTSAAIGFAGLTVHAIKAGVPVEELAIGALIRKFVSGGLTLYSMSGFAAQATEFYTRKRELMGAVT